MTNADIWLPLDPANKNSKMLYCQAWSDGYLDGVGRGIWCSSKHIHEISKASVLFAGQPFFFKPSNNIIEPHSEDFILEGIGDNLELDAATETDIDEILTSAEDTLELIKANELELAAKTMFGKISLESKIEMGIGINAYITDIDTVWNNLCEDGQVLSVEDACVLLIKHAGTLNSGYILSKNSYIWKDNQFWCSVEVNRLKYVVPLALVFAVCEHGEGCYGDLAYLEDLTMEDKYVLDAFAQELINNGMLVTRMLNGKYAYAEEQSPSM